MTSRAAVAVLLAGALGAGCVAADESEPASGEDAFSVNPFPTSFSLLPAIENSGGKIDVCVGLVGFTPAKAQEAAAKLPVLIKDSVRKWNALLTGNPLWTLNREIETTVNVYTGRCPSTLGTFRVSVWATAQGFIADHCSTTSTCAPAANPGRREIFLGPYNRGRAQDMFAPYVMLHEYGHLLGLGDTYKTPGALDFPGTQPPSVMNVLSQTLTDDDKRGLWVTLRELKTGIRSCDGFGAEIPMTANTSYLMMCDPRAVPQQNHGGAQPAPQPALPREGIWAYQGYNVNVSAIRIRAVARRLAGYTLLLADVQNGQPTPGNESRYDCDMGGVCTGLGDARFRFLVASPTSARLIDPNTPAGIQVSFSRP